MSCGDGKRLGEPGSRHGDRGPDRNEQHRHPAAFERFAHDRRSPSGKLLRPAESDQVRIHLVGEPEDVLTREPKLG